MERFWWLAAVLGVAGQVCSAGAIQQFRPNEKAIPSDLTSWIETTPPVAYSKQWYAANYDFNHQWQFSMDHGKVRVQAVPEPGEKRAKLPFTIAKSRETYGNRSAWKVDDGWLVGFDGGEWGGSLWWYSSDGKKRHKVSDDQIRSFVKTPAGLLISAGLAHLGMSYGQLKEVSKDTTGVWKTTLFVDLGAAPEVLALDSSDGSLVVATTARLLRVHPNRQVDVLVPHAFWAGLYPMSILLHPNGDVYIGMRHGVARIEKRREGYNVIWLVPNKEFLNAKAGWP